MSVLVRNETSSPWIFEASAGGRQLAPGATQVISEDEWESIITAKRGAGQINALWPAQTDQTTLQLDYFEFGSGWQIRWIGVAALGALTSDSTWTIKQLSYSTVGGNVVVTEIQALSGVIWDNRASLGWS